MTRVHFVLQVLGIICKTKKENPTQTTQRDQIEFQVKLEAK